MNRLRYVCRASSTLSYAHTPSTVPFLSETVGQLMYKSTEKTPDKTFCVFPHQKIKKNYAEVLSDSRNLAASLYSLGLKRGDRVGIWGPNYYQWITTHHACALAGFVLVNVNPAYKTPDVQYALQKVEVKALITPSHYKTSDYFSSLAEIIPEMRNEKAGRGNVHSHLLPNLKHIVVFDPQGTGKKYSGAWDYNDILSAADSTNYHRVDDEMRKVGMDDPFNIQFTSGTTGSPKAATLSHFNIVNNAYFTGLNTGYADGNEVICVPNPLYHTMGCVAGMVNAMIHSQSLAFPSETFNAGEALKAIEKEKATFVFGTPTMFIDILNHPNFKKTDVSSVHGGYIAAAPIPKTLCERLLSDLGMKDIVVLYGCTETSPVVTMSTYDHTPQERIKSCGYTLDHCETTIVSSSSGRAVPRGHRGELLTRGFQVMSGYWNDEEKTREAIDKNGWYHTGDTAIMHEDGAISIVGRLKDMIIRGGENVYPTEIEQIIFKHDKVADAHVIGVPDTRLGEEVCAWIRLKDDQTMTDEELREYCKDKMAHYKIPKYILFKTEHDFPLTATGKVQKFELRRLSKIELGLEQVQSHFNE